MKQLTYKTFGTCSKFIELTVNDDSTIEDVTFIGGCQGNTKGVSRLVKGRKVDEVIQMLKGIDCGGKGTSCPDQLSKALEQIKDK